MGILDQIKKVLKKDGEEEEVLCALVFVKTDGGKMVQSKVIGPTPGARVFEDVNSLVLTSMVCALEEFEEMKKALVAAGLTDMQYRQILLIDSYNTVNNPVKTAVAKILNTQEGQENVRGYV